LIYVAKNDEDVYVRRVAIKRITNQKVVKELELLLEKRIELEESIRKKTKELENTSFRSKGGTASSPI